MTRLLEKHSQDNGQVVNGQPQRSPTAVRRILLAEDNDMARRQLQQLLQVDPQFEVDATGDGKEALQRLLDGNYSLMITDLRMPQLDGMDLIRAVQQRGLPVTVIVTTG